ncbi:ScbR family autoregulator-binding transcription factor [Kitasatospora sp. RG8]|uniref:ScbR family autoregulator-binding transcription factor n=1 Tax=Kitasatospora sp. RG8 TaxID=2820815 RepID=UPI0027DC1367|nr:ScbR family autoregulator-binding transcription factor [Kitasatospora sp. RG8]
MGRLGQERSERTRGRLVREGAVRFDRSGYAGATLAEIASAAGVTKGALYFHFSSKEELARAVVAHAERALRGALGTLRAGSSPLQALIDAGYWLVAALHTDPVVRAAFRLGHEDGAWQGEGEPVAGVRGIQGVWAGAVRELLAGARRAGELRGRSGGTGPESLVVAAACGLEVLGVATRDRADLHRRMEALWEWLLPSLVPPGAVGSYRTAAPPAL